ncbi:MAG: peptidylprolyl isomerase [Burkholderiales bacterium]|nr:peptidylprolyl isomerase [Burkholderiales bacterium]MCE7877248.1 peptidylprolyl isomerase [Betaproteobacteria bacterium PRO3]
MTRTTIALAVMAALALPAAHAQAPAAPKAAAAKAADSGKALYPQSTFDAVLKDRVAQGQPDSPELRALIREELNTRELLAREARKKGLDKSAEVKSQMDLASQTVLVRAYVADWVKNNPIPEADLRKEYDAIKNQIGDKEYKVAHILVDNEQDAKDVITELQKGAKFADLAKARSKDPGSKDKGGDLDWNAPANFVKPFSDAMVKAEKGKFTPQPVQTQFGWHVILVEDVRAAKVPSFDEVKPQLAQRMQAQHLDKYFRELRAKNGV